MSLAGSQRRLPRGSRRRALLLAALFSACGLALAGIAAPAGAADALLAPSAACPAQQQRSASADAKRRAIVCLLNWARAERGLRPVNISPTLELAAEQKAAAIVRCGLSHSPCRLSSRRFLHDAGYGLGRRSTFGENLLLSSWPLSPRSVVAVWLDSAGHRANLLNPAWRDVGIAEAETTGVDGRAVVWVVDFGRTRAP